NTPGNPLALQIKNRIRNQNETAALTFNTTPITQFDNSQEIITDKAATTLAAALRLQVTR
ncbi:MAG: hypothetical protein NZ561_05800, partial [Phycisphaerae bacterium]|nr:hypothetical protein [Phycisphaerae bacterium]MDW8262627.1 hypothetical protein [Phycisphaerales bacterium]